MYFNGIPQGFGLGQYEDPSDLMNKPAMGYNQGIGSIQQQNPSNPAPQLGNIGGMANQSSSNNSTTGNAGKSIAPLPPFQKPAPGQMMAKGGVVRETLDKSNVVSNGIAALRGKHSNPRGALDAYDKMFGNDATTELIRAYADGGVVSGPGSGVADLVPGSIDGREDVRIASGEYVIPAWAVAALGDGSTEAGAKVLDAMVARLREAGSELIMGTEPINPNEFLPA